jgi:hypothetical protein
MSISAMKQAFSALREMRHALSRAHDTMRRPTKYFSDAMTKSESAIKALQQAIAEAEKQPVHASDISQERVDETAKGEHKREWVGLDGEIPGLGLVTEEFYNGMIVAEDILREKNT